MEVIAKRDRVLSIVLLSLGLVLTVLSGLLLSESLWYIIALIFGVVFFLAGIYGGLLLPKNAIIKLGENLLIKYAFHSELVSIDKIEYVSYHEIGEFYTRDGFMTDLHILQNDLRRIIITTKQNGLLKHYGVIVLNASAVTVTINALKDKVKNK